MGHGHVFHIDGADPFTAGLDHVLAAVSDLHETVGVDGGHIPGGEPAIHQRRSPFSFEVLVNDPGATHQQVTKRAAIPRQFLAFAVDNFHVHAVHDSALLQTDLEAARIVQCKLLVLERASRAQRGHLCHAPGMQHLHAVGVLERGQHGGRAGRAADDGAVELAERQATGLHVTQQHLPHGGHTRRQTDVFALDQLVDGLAIHGRAGKHQLAAHRSRCIRQAPGIDVEHGHHGQYRITGAQVQ